MFTGIIETLGEVVSLKKKEDTLLLGLKAKEIYRKVKIGESISVNGVCLTLTKKLKGVLYFQLVRETLERSNLGDLKEGDKVNLERSLRLKDPLGGHIVLGHVDGVGIIKKREDFKEFSNIWVNLPEDLKNMVIPKGSIALDGVSLTIAKIEKDSIMIALIPHTLKLTTLGFKREGDKVNIEIDVIGKWVKKILEENYQFFSKNLKNSKS
ncbi:Riboflavin synthase [archaeon HR06]|nr:Riboflavin synthase [archaeon HR06]